MKNFNLQNLEKELKKLDLPDFGLSQKEKLLRQNLLNSPYFKKERSLFPFFKIALAPVGAVCLILLFVFLGYPYGQSFYSEAKAQNILNRAETAIENLGENKEIYAFTSSYKGMDLPLGRIYQMSPDDVEEFKNYPPIIPPAPRYDPSLPPDTATQTTVCNLQKLDLDFNQLKKAKEKGEIKFLQYAGKEEINNTTLEKIRYSNQEGTIITEIKIDSKTNLPVEINNWGPKEIMKSPKDIINVPRDIDNRATEDGEKLIETETNIEVIIIEKEKNQDTSPESPEQEENLEDLPPCTIAE